MHKDAPSHEKQDCDARERSSLEDNGSSCQRKLFILSRQAQMGVRWKDAGVEAEIGSLKRIKTDILFNFFSWRHYMVQWCTVGLKALKATRSCLFLVPLYSTDRVNLCPHLKSPCSHDDGCVGPHPECVKAWSTCLSFTLIKQLSIKTCQSQNHLSVSAFWVYATFSVSLWHLASLSNSYFTRYELISGPR